MRIAVACGGTGGHIFPGLATAHQLRVRGHDVSLWMAGKDVESQAVQGWDGPVVTVPAEGLPRRISPAMFRAVLRMLQTRRACQRLMQQHAPDGVLAMGSYASVGPVLAARRLRIPYVLHESNVVPGRAISLLARRASAVAISFDTTRYHLRRVEVRETGMPLRADLVEAARLPLPARDGAPFTVLFMGGSRGARAINEIGCAAACRAICSGVSLRVIHIAGLQGADAVRARYQQAGVDARVESFVHDMASVYRQADLVVCRSGAASCAELCIFGRPALLVPLPSAIRDHQTANARALERAGAAQVVAERNLRIEWLAEYLADGVAHPERLEPMGAAARVIGKLDAAESLAELVESTVERSRVHRR